MKEYDHQWVFPAEVKRVTDGDTIEVMADVGFGTYCCVVLRLNRINAYETRLGKNTTAAMKKKGKEGKAFLKRLIEEKNIYIRTFKLQGKYGRYIAEIYIPYSGELPEEFSSETGARKIDWMLGESSPFSIEGLLNLNDLMVANGYAVYQDY